MRALAHGFTELRAHPWRALLSGISLCIGVLAVVAIFTISAVTAEVFIAVAEQRQGRAVTAVGDLTVAQVTPERVRSALAAAAPLTDAGGAAAIVGNPTQRTGVAHWDGLDPGEPLALQPVTLVAGDLDDVRRLPILSGRWLNTHAEFPVELVVNQAGAQRWGGPGTTLAVLATVDQPAVRATIVGVVADGEGESTIFASLPALLHLRPTILTGTTSRILLHHSGGDMAFLNAVGERMVRAAGGDPQALGLHRGDQVEHLLQQLASQRFAFLTVALIALLVSALGILNIGLASVHERTRELVIRRAVGATRGALVGQVLTAAVLVGLLAAVVAVLTAWLGVEWWVPRRIDAATAIETPTLPWNAVLWGITAAAATSVVGSLIPALVAARLDVATALRD
ncbi:ABC transporter permease [Solwaraspora sp. WMMD792]|uniref:ABC transporter permease n=1 Tax=Solwaraspora sp. WMMD792 TaxID=3016099 RepID=UPI002418024A|nr:ABC transporter permease [Solwaraspora sp. WMMD792]MDG4773990.1 ABC transporter permease [Solwaraspora sp. WMMD792]